MFRRKKDKRRPPTEGQRAVRNPKSTLFFTKAECGQVYTPNPDYTNFSYPLRVRYIYE